MLFYEQGLTVSPKEQGPELVPVNLFSPLYFGTAGSLCSTPAERLTCVLAPVTRAQRTRLGAELELRIQVLGQLNGR